MSKGKVLIAIAAIGGVILAIVAIVNKIISNGDSGITPEITE